MIHSPSHFVLAIDQKMDMFLNHMASLAMDNPDYSRRIESNGLEETSQEFYTAMVEGSSRVVWCNVAGCKGGRCEHKEEPSSHPHAAPRRTSTNSSEKMSPITPLEHMGIYMLSLMREGVEPEDVLPRMSKDLEKLMADDELRLSTLIKSEYDTQS